MSLMSISTPALIARVFASRTLAFISSRFPLVQRAELRQKTQIQVPPMFSLVQKRLSQIDRNCSKVHGYLIKLAMGKHKEKPFSKEFERRLHAMIAAISNARNTLNDLLEENEKN